MVDEYIVGRFIAGGGAGLIYEATHRSTREKMALKVMRRALAASPVAASRFLREIEIIKQIQHPNIVRIERAGELEDGRCYYLMELLEGPNLSGLLRQKGRLSLAEAMDILESVVGGLDAAHRANCVHRDIKASNIIVTAVEGRPTAKLLDFGVAKLLQPDPGQAHLTQIGQRIGSLHTMAPEQILGGLISPATDIYALGVLLYRLLTNRYPYHSVDDAELEEMHVHAPVPQPSALAPVSAAVDAVVLRCLDKSPHARYSSAVDFLDALRAAAATRQPSPETKTRALAIYVNGGITDPCIDEAHQEDLLDQLDELMEEIQRALIADGFQLLSSTHDSVLAVQARPHPDESSDEHVRYGMTIAHELYTTARARVPRELRCTVVVHHGVAYVASRGAANEVVGGEVTRLALWCPVSPTEGVHIVEPR